MRLTRCASVVAFGTLIQEIFTLKAPKPAGARVAIATIYDGSEEYRCAMPLWCITAGEISMIIPSSEVVVLGPRPPDDCTQARWVWGAVGEETLRAAGEYLNSNKVGGDWSYLKRPALLKIAMMGLVQYRLLLYGTYSRGMFVLVAP